MTLAWQTELRQTEKLVLLALADNANDEGQCFPAVATLMRRCCMTDRGVQKIIGMLVQQGHITQHFRPGKSTVYIVHPRTAVHPEHGSPRTVVHPTPEPPFTTTPERRDENPRTAVHPNLKKPSIESSVNRQEARKRAQTPTATRLPADFVLSPERRTVAVAERLDAERTFAKFCDYWRAASGARARKVDWEATWRNWCRTEADRSGNGHVSTASEPIRTWEPPEDDHAAT